MGKDDEKVQDEWIEVGKKNKAVVSRTTETGNTFISRLFGGQIRSVVRSGGKNSITYEPFLSLQLDIAVSFVNGRIIKSRTFKRHWSN